MPKTSVDWIKELNQRDIDYLAKTRRLHCLFQLDNDYKVPRRLSIAEDFVFAIDRIFFGADGSFRRRIFGRVPLVIRPLYFMYDLYYKGWVVKQPVKRKWLDTRDRYNKYRLMEDAKKYYKELEKV
tara:strand:- start:207 stop:584 length:378 start_codon:yes stop_codon:yes gene_type:complete